MGKRVIQRWRTFASYGITIQRRYHDDESKEWKSAKGFRNSDLLILAFTAQELYRKIRKQKQK